MATKHRTKGFVFKKSDRTEADRIFSVFTEDYGRVEIFGKAIRKINSKLKGGIDILCFSEVEFIQGKNNRTLTGATKIKRFDDISKNFEKLKIAYRITDVMDSFLKGQEKDENIFELLNEIFEKLNSSQLSIENQQLIYYYFLWNFLSLLGYHPQVYKCAECSFKLESEKLYFSNRDGGVICEKCFNINKNAKKINDNFVKVIRLFLKKDWQVLSRLKIDESLKITMESISENYFNYLTPKSDIL